MRPIIETHNLTKYYPRMKSFRQLITKPLQRGYVPALENVNLSLQKGCILGLLGPNGAGKTTLIKIISTLVHPSSGRASVNGFDVVQQDIQVRRSVGIVMTEERSFFWRLTGRQNLLFFATLNNLSGEERHRRVRVVLNQTELEKDADRMFKDYSTGMKQRLAIARGLLCDPAIILLDEPTRSLDPHSARQLITFIRESIVGKQNRTALLATHNLQEAEWLCTHVAVMKSGRLLAQGRIDAFTSADYYILRLASGIDGADLGRLPGVQQVVSLPGEDDSVQIQTHDISSVIRAIIAQGGGVRECFQKRLSLDEVFSQIIDGKTQ